MNRAPKPRQLGRSSHVCGAASPQRVLEVDSRARSTQHSGRTGPTPCTQLLTALLRWGWSPEDQLEGPGITSGRQKLFPSGLLMIGVTLRNSAHPQGKTGGGNHRPGPFCPFRPLWASGAQLSAQKIAGTLPARRYTQMCCPPRSRPRAAAGAERSRTHPRSATEWPGARVVPKRPPRKVSWDPS